MSAVGLPPEEQPMAVPVAPGQAPLPGEGDYAPPPPREPQPDDPIVGREYKITRKDGRVDPYIGKFLFFMGNDELVFKVGNKMTYAYRDTDDITEVKGGRRRRSRKSKRRVRKTRRNYK